MQTTYAMSSAEVRDVAADWLEALGCRVDSDGDRRLGAEPTAPLDPCRLVVHHATALAQDIWRIVVIVDPNADEGS